MVATQIGALMGAAALAGVNAAVVGLLLAALCLGVQHWAIQSGDTHWQTMVFTVLTLAQMALVLAERLSIAFSDHVIISNDLWEKTLVSLWDLII